MYNSINKLVLKEEAIKATQDYDMVTHRKLICSIDVFKNKEKKNLTNNQSAMKQKD